MRVIFERMTEQTTPRKCVNCQKQASLWRFRTDKSGAKNKSSRQAVCEKHGGGQ